MFTRFSEVQQAVDEMVADGYIAAILRDDGQIGYVITPKGEEAWLSGVWDQPDADGPNEEPDEADDEYEDEADDEYDDDDKAIIGNLIYAYAH